MMIGSYRPAAWAALAAVAAPMLLLGGCNKAAPTSASASAPATADAAAAKAFLEGVYAHYRTNPKDGAAFDITSTDVIDPGLVQLIKDDNKAMNGDVGVVDYDWMCSCQDWVSLSATINVTAATATTAQAAVDVVDTGMTGSDRAPRRIGFDLVTVGGQWRIHDVHAKDQPSLRDALTKEIAEQKKTPASR